METFKYHQLSEESKQRALGFCLEVYYTDWADDTWLSIDEKMPALILEKFHLNVEKFKHQYRDGNCPEKRVWFVLHIKQLLNLELLKQVHEFVINYIDNDYKRLEDEEFIMGEIEAQQNLFYADGSLIDEEDE